MIAGNRTFFLVVLFFKIKKMQNQILVLHFEVIKNCYFILQPSNWFYKQADYFVPIPVYNFLPEVCLILTM